MAYTAYEPSSPSDAAMAQIEALQQNRTAAGSFSGSTNPTTTIVEQHLTTIHARMAGMLAAESYDPTQTDGTVLSLLMEFNTRGAGYLIELSASSVGFAADEGQGRLAEFAKWDSDFQELLETTALDNLGAATLSSGNRANGLTSGGIAIDDKTDIADDSDATRTTFKREQFTRDGVLPNRGADGGTL